MKLYTASFTDNKTGRELTLPVIAETCLDAIKHSNKVAPLFDYTFNKLIK